MATELLGLQYPFNLIICVKVESNSRHSAARVPLLDTGLISRKWKHLCRR